MSPAAIVAPPVNPASNGLKSMMLAVVSASKTRTRVGTPMPAAWMPARTRAMVPWWSVPWMLTALAKPRSNLARW